MLRKIDANVETKEIQLISEYEELRLRYGLSDDDECIIRLYDNKSRVFLQSIIISHPISFLRNLPDFSKNLNLPVSDLEIILVGFLSPFGDFSKISENIIVSPYLYFKKPDDVSVNVGSDGSTPPVES